MNKEAQPVLVNIFPLQSINRRSVISSAEAEYLYKIWQSKKDE